MPFEEAYQDALGNFPSLVKAHPPSVLDINRVKRRVRLEKDDEDMFLDDDLRTVEAWAVFEHEGRKNLAVILFRCFEEEGHLGWYQKAMDVEWGPYVRTRPYQDLTDMVEVNEDSEGEMDFRRRMNVWPSGYRPR